GVDAVNIHMWPGAPANQLFTFAKTHGRWSGRVRPEYYGLLLFNRAMPPGARLLKTQATPNGSVQSWATVAPDGRIRVVLMNTALTAAKTVLVAAGNGSVPAVLQRLVAPSAFATSGVTLAGRTFPAATFTGRMPGPPRTIQVPATASGYNVTLAPASAAMLTVAP
ncbi:MAG: hypothetical protein JO304_21895, partial [Solirubrobacterales bacterium]|nr:hypothetical protein [Solirubrobacterales bacterium]